MWLFQGKIHELLWNGIKLNTDLHQWILTNFSIRLAHLHPLVDQDLDKIRVRQGLMCTPLNNHYNAISFQDLYPNNSLLYSTKEALHAL